MKKHLKTTTTSRAIVALLEIMRDTQLAPRRHLEAAEHLLDYECPSEVIEEAKAAVMAIVEASENVDLKLDALKLLRRVEAKRVSPGRATSQQDIEKARAYELFMRRDTLYRAGIAPPWPDGYADDISGPGFVPLPEPDPEPEPRKR